MRKFKFTDASGAELIKEFSKRVIADEYDSYDEVKIPEDSQEFHNWLEEQSIALYNEIMESVNNYCDFGGIQDPPVK